MYILLSVNDALIKMSLKCQAYCIKKQYIHSAAIEWHLSASLNEHLLNCLLAILFSFGICSALLDYFFETICPRKFELSDLSVFWSIQEKPGYWQKQRMVSGASWRPSENNGRQERTKLKNSPRAQLGAYLPWSRREVWAFLTTVLRGEWPVPKSGKD